MEIENGRSLEAESKVNGVLEKNGKDSVSGLIHHQRTAQLVDSINRDRGKKDNSATCTISASQDNSNSSLVEDMATAEVEMDTSSSKSGEICSEHVADGGREGEDDEMEMSSKRPRRRASNATKPKKVEPKVSTLGRA